MRSGKSRLSATAIIAQCWYDTRIRVDHLLYHRVTIPSKSRPPFIPFLFLSLRLRGLCSDDSDFFHKSESMCQFFEKRGSAYFCRSSGSPPRATYWSTVITTNITKRTFRPHSILFACIFVFISIAIVKYLFAVNVSNRHNLESIYTL